MGLWAWTGEWVKRPVRTKVAFGPFFHRLTLLLVIVVVPLLVFWTVITTGFESEAVLSSNYNLKNTGVVGAVDEFLSSLPGEDRDNLCTQKLIEVGNEFYTTNGLFKWSLDRVLTNTTIDVAANNLIPRPNSVASKAESVGYAGEHLDVCNIVDLGITLLNFADDDVNFRVKDDPVRFDIGMMCNMSSWTAYFRSKTREDMALMIDDISPLSTARIHQSLRSGALGVQRNEFRNRTFCGYERISIKLLVDDRCGNNVTCLDAKPQLTVERLDWLFHDGVSIPTVGRYPYVSLLEDGFWHMPEFSGNCSINMDHIVYRLLDAARWDLGAIGNNNTHTTHEARDKYVVAVRTPAGTINTQFICNIKKRKAWGSFIISVGSALFGVLFGLWELYVLVVGLFTSKKSNQTPAADHTATDDPDDDKQPLMKSAQPPTSYQSSLTVRSGGYQQPGFVNHSTV